MTDQPYRTPDTIDQAVEEPKPSIPDATPDEIRFWEMVYASRVMDDRYNAYTVANEAIQNRRKAFGHCPEIDLKPYPCSMCDAPGIRSTPTSKGKCQSCRDQCIEADLDPDE